MFEVTGVTRSADCAAPAAGTAAPRRGSLAGVTCTGCGDPSTGSALGRGCGGLSPPATPFAHGNTRRQPVPLVLFWKESLRVDHLLSGSARGALPRAVCLRVGAAERGPPSAGASFGGFSVRKDGSAGGAPRVCSDPGNRLCLLRLPDLGPYFISQNDKLSRVLAPLQTPLPARTAPSVCPPSRFLFALHL